MSEEETGELNLGEETPSGANPSENTEPVETAKDDPLDPLNYPPYRAMDNLSNMLTNHEADLKILPNFGAIIRSIRGQNKLIRAEIVRNLQREVDSGKSRLSTFD